MTQQLPLTALNLFEIVAGLRAGDRAELRAMGFDDPVFTAVHAAQVWKIGAVFAHGDALAAAIGAGPVRRGVWKIGMLATDDWPRVAPAVTRYALTELWRLIAVEFGAHRVDCETLAAHVEAHRWIERCGGHREATLTGWGVNGEDFYLYAWTREAGGRDWPPLPAPRRMAMAKEGLRCV